MTAKQFFKSNVFKCLVTLLCVLLVSGIFLTIMYGFLEVTAGERLQRAISKIYEGETVAVYGKNGEITADDTAPEGLISDSMDIGDATILEAYRVELDGDTDYLVKSLGKGGFSGGSVTCWVPVKISGGKISGLRKINIAENVGQTYLSKITDGYLESFGEKYKEDIYYSAAAQDNPDKVDGATFSSTAICNSVNGAIEFVNTEMLGIEAVDIFDGFDFKSFVNSKLSSYTVDDVAGAKEVTYHLVTAGYNYAGAFTIDITVYDDNGTAKIKTYEIIVDGSTEGYGSHIPQSIKDGTLFIGKDLTYFTGIYGDNIEYTENDTLNSGATFSCYICNRTAAFALKNYQKCVDAAAAGNEGEGGENNE